MYDTKPLVCSRMKAAELLDCSVSNVIRLERLGRLTPIRLTGNLKGRAHYRLSEIEALAQPEATAE